MYVYILRALKSLYRIPREPFKVRAFSFQNINFSTCSGNGLIVRDPTLYQLRSYFPSYWPQQVHLPPLSKRQKPPRRGYFKLYLNSFFTRCTPWFTYNSHYLLFCFFRFYFIVIRTVNMRSALLTKFQVHNITLLPTDMKLYNRFLKPIRFAKLRLHAR